MSRQVLCVRPIRFFGTDFRVSDVVDVDAFAEDLGKDADWLFGKFTRPQIQVGRDMVSCFVVDENGGGEEEDVPSMNDATPPADPESESTEDAGNDNEASEGYPQQGAGNWWVLSNGRKVLGLTKARAEQADLDAENTTEVES